MHEIFVVSDGSGGTAEQAVKAALTQFDDSPVVVHRRGGVRTEDQVRSVLVEASERDAFVVHTIVTASLRGVMGELGRVYDVVTVDLIGPLLTELTHQFAHTPSERPGIFRALNKEYFQRIDAMEFALRHDDGQRVEELDRAEVVLVGVSRTFKTPLSVYLAFKGFFVANVPIILDLEPPPILLDLDPDKVFALVMDPSHLAHLRKAREIQLGGQTGEYAKRDFAKREVLYARHLFAANPGWFTIDVTNRPIEEIATQILTRLREVRASGPGASPSSST